MPSAAKTTLGSIGFFSGHGSASPEERDEFIDRQRDATCRSRAIAAAHRGWPPWSHPPDPRDVDRRGVSRRRVRASPGKRSSCAAPCRRGGGCRGWAALLSSSNATLIWAVGFLAAPGNSATGGGHSAQRWGCMCAGGGALGRRVPAPSAPPDPFHGGDAVRRGSPLGWRNAPQSRNADLRSSHGQHRQGSPPYRGPSSTRADSATGLAGAT